MIRKIILSILGLLMIFGAYTIAQRTASNKEARKPKVQKKIITSAFVETVKNQNSEISITTSGNLRAKNRGEIFSEVQGIFKTSSHPFKPGTWFKAGDVLLELDKKEELIALKAQKSSFYNQLVLLIPDLRLDYPDAFPKWDTYVRQYDVEKPLPELPKVESEQEKLFLSGKNIYTTYYNVKNLEVQLENYTIYAPFTGILTEALADPGMLIRPGQKLGTFINPNTYELEVAINTSYGDLLKIGKQVALQNIEGTKKWTGKVIRINSLVDPASQTIPTFIQVSGAGLKEGMYLEARVKAKEEKNTFEINRKLLVDNDKVFYVKDSVLNLVKVEPVYFKEETAIIKGLEDGTKILANAIPGAYVGMRVKIFSDESI